MFLALMELQQKATDRVQELTNLLQEKIRQFQKLQVCHTFFLNQTFYTTETELCDLPVYVREIEAKECTI